MKLNDMKQKAKKAVFSAMVAGGLLGGQAAQASVPAETSIPSRVAMVRETLAKKVAEAEKSGLEAVKKLPYAQIEVASWLNWYNWPNWRNWGNWGNWSNWSNWFNF